MLDLFRTELSNHTRILEAGLVGLEQEQTPQRVEPLMRAAHSIKGAARIVGLDPAVHLAHAMEDLLSAAQRNEVRLSTSAIDTLLAGNDLFTVLARASVNALQDQLESKSGEIERLGEALRGELSVGAAGVAARPVEAVTPVPRPAAIPDSAGRGEDQAPTARSGQGQEKPDENLVRVLAENLNRLLGLTGECLVQAKATKPFAASWVRIKARHLEIGGTLEALSAWAAADERVPKEIRTKVIQSVTASEQISEQVRKNIEQFELFSTRLEQLTDRLYAEVVSTRMRPFSEGVFAFPRMVRDLARNSGKKIKFEIIGGATRVDRDILEKLEAPLTHLLRNAIDHGVEPSEERVAAGKDADAIVVLEARHSSGMLHVAVSDDGRGIDKDRLRRKVVQRGYVTEEMAAELTPAELMEFLFLPGFSTAEKVTETSGRGVGLDVVQSMTKEVGGTVQVESTVGKGTTFHLRLPLTLSVVRTLIVEIGGQYYAVPLTRLDRIVITPRDEVRTLEDRQFCSLDGEPLGLLEASQVLQLSSSGSSEQGLSVLVVSDRLTRYGVVVSRILGERDLVVLPLDPRLGRVPNISAGAILEDGTPVLILDVEDLVRSIDNLLSQGKPGRISQLRAAARAAVGKRILVVDDSLTVREVERRLLENRGYEVVVTVDGIDGWNALQTSRFDLVVTDVDMPRMDGIELVRKIKTSTPLKDLPVMIVSYKDREEDKIKGMQAGADYYLTKSSFHDESLLNAVRDLIGSP
ncbi:MAG: hybrid sensor histidine kinase/response regulator [Acidobacteria bacterium]|nr:MAG: hybrid sensor histidine kinase/response regulator [Acidobacteriota bacterium]